MSVRLLRQAWGDGERSRGLEPLGVIDIGSNSVRLVIYEGAVRSLTALFNEKVLCGLGRAIATTGKLEAESIACALGALARFRAVARTLGVKNLRAVATAAVREASNGADFITRAEKSCGTRIEVLRGEKEAELAAQGIMMGFVGADGIAGDLGGGSLELIDLADERLAHATTLPLGGLRLMDSSSGKTDDAVLLTDAELAHVPWLDQGRGRAFYAIGGTWRAIARLHIAMTNYPLRVIDGYAIPTSDAIALCEAVRKAKKPMSFPGTETFPKARREVLPYGALVMERVLRMAAPSEVVFSVFGIREGLVFSLLPEHERRKDPLLSFCEDYAAQRSRSLAHARELVEWTNAIFDGANDETAEERRLRHAACLISDVGWRAHPDYRGEQSLSMVAHAALGGIDHPGRFFLALTMYFRHAGPAENSGDALSERLKAAVTKRALKRARTVAAAIRAAHMLSAGMPGVICETPVSRDKAKLVVTLPKAYAALDGERFRGRLATLAGLLDREPQVRFEG